MARDGDIDDIETDIDAEPNAGFDDHDAEPTDDDALDGRPSAVHLPVMLDEVIDALQLRPGMVAVDGTAGAGGHLRRIAEAVGPDGRVLAIDRDPNMLELARAATTEFPWIEFQRASYADLPEILDEAGLESIDALVLDLGLSSDQLAWRDRGFAFSAGGPLDMRFNPESNDPTAADLISRLPERELADIIYRFGEERFSRRIARRVVEERKIEPIDTAERLAAIVRRAVPGGRRAAGGIDPATRTFQALRIAVNRELEHLDELLEFLPDLVAEGGRVAILSFHSLEDRRVKHAFRDDARWRVAAKKPRTASAEELRVNPRARSAKLRVAERCPNTTTPHPQT